MVTLLEQLAATTALQWIAMAAGILGVWLSIRQKVAAWPLFILCYGCYLYLYFGNLKAFAGMNAVFILISIYGWIQWTRSPGERADEIPITRTPRAHWPMIGAIIVIATGGIGWLLSQNSEANAPYIDALATLCAFIAQWMLTRKHIETWIFWLISDVIYLVLVFQQQDWPTVILFTIFIYLALKGLRDWSRQLN